MVYGIFMSIKLMKKLIYLQSMKFALINCPINFKLLAKNTSGNLIKMIYGESN
jgi:hypothetical protein